MKPHKHDWHCGDVFAVIRYPKTPREFYAGYASLWACSLCGAVKELRSKEVVRT